MVDQESRKRFDTALAAFSEAGRGLPAASDRVLARRGFGRAHQRILSFLARHPDAAVGDILRGLGVSKQALNRPLRDLVDGGWVQMRQDPTNRRAKRLRLSAGGADLEWKLTGPQHALLEAAFAAGGPGAEDTWLRVMRALAAGVQTSSR